MVAPLINTKRLVMRSYHAGMVTDQHVSWLNDPDVVKYSEQRHKTHTIESQHEYLNGIWKMERTKTGIGNLIWMITKKGKDIGSMTAYVDDFNRIANMGIMIGEKSEWGHGYATEAWIAGMDWLRRHDMRKVEAGTMLTNGAMLSLASKAKMEIEGSIKGHFMFEGKSIDLICLGKML